MSQQEQEPTPAVERQLVADMSRRAVLATPVVALVAGLVWGVDGALSAAFAVGLVLVNLALSAFLLAKAARISLTAIAVTAMVGFFARGALVVLAVLAVKDQAWVERVPLGVTLVVAHLGLLAWEAHRVSASLAFPGLKPRASASEAQPVRAEP